MKCERFNELIYLFLDARLENDEEVELREHLSACEECAQKLAFLRSMEGVARKVDVEEPPQEYWDAFSSRVRERIVQREEKPFGFGLKKTLQGVFSLSPLKMKVAAGLISVVLVLVVGRLFVDYHGQEMAPSKVVIRREEQPHSDTMRIVEKGGVPGAEYRDETAQPADRPRREQKTVDMEEGKEKARPDKELVTEGRVLVGEADIATPSEMTQERGVSAPKPTAADQAGSESEAATERAADSPSSEQTGAGAEEKPDKGREPGIPAEGKKLTELERLSVEGKREKMIMKDVTASVRAVRPEERYRVNNVSIPKIQEYDTLMQMDALMGAIRTWRDFIDKNPTDSLAREGYLQVAMGYYLLAKPNQDSTVISDGEKVIETYLTQASEPVVKEKLSEILAKIIALKEK